VNRSCSPRHTPRIGFPLFIASATISAIGAMFFTAGANAPTPGRTIASEARSSVGVCVILTWAPDFSSPFRMLLRFPTP
jgi:hypothetical protein